MVSVTGVIFAATNFNDPFSVLMIKQHLAILEHLLLREIARQRAEKGDLKLH